MARRKFARAASPCHECGKVGRRLRELCAECLGYSSNALTEGRWVLDPRRRVMVWQGSITPAATVTAQTEAANRRREAEDARYTDVEAARAHQAYKRGDRGEWAVVGHRVYCRLMTRLRRQKVA